MDGTPAEVGSGDDLAISLDGLGKRYEDGTVAVADLTLPVRRGELVCLVGPSGCGKSTTLRMVNRLVEPTSGRILLDGEDVTDIDAVQLRRRMGYVIQAGGLFPHRTVGQNVATVPRLLGWDRKRTAARVDELMDLIGLDAGTYRDRYPSALSGGQQQRIGVARALAADPPVLLMDEPFGAVDPVVRMRLQHEFRALLAGSDKTVLFVTHDLEEATTIGDRIAVFSQGGHLEQYDVPEVVLARPATPFVADFVGRDRGIRHLAVTPLREAHLATPPTVRTTDRPGFAGSRLGTVGAQWGIVVDPAGELAGWVTAADLRAHDGAATVAEIAREVPATAQLDGAVLPALARVLTLVEGWLAVCDGNRYVGVLDRAGLPPVSPGPANASGPGSDDSGTPRPDNGGAPAPDDGSRQGAGSRSAAGA